MSTTCNPLFILWGFKALATEKALALWRGFPDFCCGIGRLAFGIGVASCAVAGNEALFGDRILLLPSVLPELAMMGAVVIDAIFIYFVGYLHIAIAKYAYSSANRKCLDGFDDAVIAIAVTAAFWFIIGMVSGFLTAQDFSSASEQRKTISHLCAIIGFSGCIVVGLSALYGIGRVVVGALARLCELGRQASGLSVLSQEADS